MMQAAVGYRVEHAIKIEKNHLHICSYLPATAGSQETLIPPNIIIYHNGPCCDQIKIFVPQPAFIRALFPESVWEV